MQEKNYFKYAKTWDQEIVASALQSRNRAWIVATTCLILSLLCITALLLLLPLKTFEPYVVAVDRHTGYLEVVRGLKSSTLSEDQAITESNLVKYVSLREQYNPAILKNNYDEVVMMSGDQALKEFRELWAANNPDNPSVKLGTKSAIEIKIKSVSFISDRIASVRFLKEKTTPKGKKESHWNAVIEFHYAQKPTKMRERLSNPLGFQVTNYRINPEALESIR
ncbi:MAG: type VI secretion protein [Alphaproteobacteria bacterium]|nr:type VI secretion protein [Alphaproteobacteria bacterium]